MQQYPPDQQPQFPQPPDGYGTSPAWQSQTPPPPSDGYGTPPAWQSQTPPPPSDGYGTPPAWQSQTPPPPAWQSQTPPPPPYAPMPGQMPNWQAGPPQQPPRKSRRKLWITIGVIALIVIIIGVVANNGNKSGTTSTQTATSANSTPTQASQPTSTPTQAGSATHKVGETVSLDNWAAVVNSAQTSAGGQYDTLQHSGDIFLEISVSVANNTGSAQTFSSILSFTLKDSSGQKYDETIVSDAPSTPDGNIATGSKLKGTVSYEVPKSMKSFEFDFSPDPIGSTDVAVWTLNV